MTTYRVKTGDTAPSPSTILLDGAGQVVPLTGATVAFKARTAPGATPLIDGPATVVDDEAGIVRYPLAAGDTDTAGAFLAEWEVTFQGGEVQTFPGDGYDELLVGTDLDASASPAGDGYCTRQQAREAGASGSDAQVDAAIAAAEVRVDRYSGQRWAPTDMTVVARVGAKGVALLPRQIDANAPVAVRYVGTTADLPVSGYQVTSSRQIGGIDAVYLGAGGGSILIAGAEPYNGGWGNLLPRTGQVMVTGTFGTAATPYEVALATALLAASITGAGPTDTVPGPAVNDEGETLAIEPAEVRASGAVSDGPIRTTGLESADALLQPLTRHPVRLS